MKAMILIAGKGTRLAPLTDYVPKCCLPIAGVPLLHIWLRELRRSGVDDVLINPSHGAKYITKSVLNSGCLPKKRLTIRTEREPKGTADTIREAADWVNKEPFFIIYGDVLTNLYLGSLAHDYDKHHALLTLTAYTTDQPEQKGILSLDDDGWVTSFTEKPEHPEGNLCFAGIAWAGPEFVREITDEDVDLTGDVFPRIVGKMRVCDTGLTYFRDIGTIPDYLACQTEWRKV